jgi:DNA-binding CsgD family transcriptional regulator
VAWADDRDLHGRLRRLTPREARVLLFADTVVTLQDIADTLETSAAVVAGIRQRIRRKLAVPKGVDLRDVLDIEGVRDVARAIADASIGSAAPDRRVNLVLRSTIRELETAMSRVGSRARALLAMAEAADDEGREAMFAEATAVETVALELASLRERTIERARARV